MVSVSFIEREYNVSEGAGSVRVGAQLDRTIGREIVVQFELTGITAEG